ncbi:hypothetical protein FQA39_LY12699 [Lamprigera yunnana]|nr:hypothetical protein FQA39_LY12699 [Lamprigera yunnana]
MTSKRPLTTSEDDPTKKQKTGGHWALGLLDSMKDPDSIVRVDSRVVVIKDRYPKAEFHYLVIAKEEIGSLKEVTVKHLGLLEHMQKVAEDLVNEDRHKERRFKIGYHGEASMVRLHLHAISDDMNSSCLKTKRHWNTFTTRFFLDSKEICKKLREEGKISLPSLETCKDLLNTSLQCHKCKYVPKNMPDLKKHILTHIK